MTQIIEGADLEGLKITPLEGGGFSVSARCHLCRQTVTVQLSAGEMEGRSQVTRVCSSGQDWPQLFQLCARYSPEETDDESGVDVWGESFEEDPY